MHFEIGFGSYKLYMVDAGRHRWGDVAEGSTAGDVPMCGDAKFLRGCDLIVFHQARSGRCRMKEH